VAQPTVGVIGLGNMGRGVALNLAKGGHPVLAWDLSETARRRVEGQDGIKSAKPVDMAAKCAIIFFVVPATAEVRACLGGSEGILRAARPGLVLCDLTTSDPTETRKLAAELKPMGVDYLDVGTSGGPTRSDSGELTLMVGGDPAVFERVSPVLEKVAKTIYYLGESGTGHTMKLLHNIVCHATFMATSEAARLGERAGMKLEDIIQVLNNSNARSYATESRFPKHILSGTWDARSRIYNLHKDLQMGLALGRSLGAGTKFSEATLYYLDKAIAHGMVNDDYSLLYRDFEEIRKVNEPVRATAPAA
jgi:3-hydroxyisobutyrate dehydrogenase